MVVLEKQYALCHDSYFLGMPSYEIPSSIDECDPHGLGDNYLTIEMKTQQGVGHTYESEHVLMV